MAFFFIPLQAIIFSGLRPDRMPAAAGLSNFVRITAGAIGTSLFTTLWENRAALHHAQIAETINRGNGAASADAEPARRERLRRRAGAARMVNRLIDQQAYTMAATDLFLLSAALFVAADRAGLADEAGEERRGRRRRRALSRRPQRISGAA